jgi:hypothetical protein
MLSRKYRVFFCMILLACCTTQVASAQGFENYKNGLRLYLNKDSTSFIRLLMWSQIWTRWQQHNPNTAINNNGNTTETWDLGIRRSRILLHGQLSPRLLVFWIIGANNQTFVNGGGGLLTGPDGVTDGKRQSVFVHDAWTEYKVSRELFVGAGLLTWSGLSRGSNAATLNFLTIDSPLYGWALLDANDQFARTFGIYAKGEIGKFNYRAVLTKPFAIPESATGWTAATAGATVGGSAAHYPFGTFPGLGGRPDLAAQRVQHLRLQRPHPEPALVPVVHQLRFLGTGKLRAAVHGGFVPGHPQGVQHRGGLHDPARSHVVAAAAQHYGAAGGDRRQPASRATRLTGRRRIERGVPDGRRQLLGPQRSRPHYAHAQCR